MLASTRVIYSKGRNHLCLQRTFPLNESCELQYQCFAAVKSLNSWPRHLCSYFLASVTILGISGSGLNFTPFRIMGLKLTERQTVAGSSLNRYWVDLFRFQPLSRHMPTNRCTGLLIEDGDPKRER